MIDELEAIQFRVFLVELPPEGDSELVEQPLMKTAYKQIVDHVKVLYPGEYLSVFEETWPGEQPISSNVHLVITPAP